MLILKLKNKFEAEFTQSKHTLENFLSRNCHWEEGNVKLRLLENLLKEEMYPRNVFVPVPAKVSPSSVSFHNAGENTSLV